MKVRAYFLMVLLVSSWACAQTEVVVVQKWPAKRVVASVVAVAIALLPVVGIQRYGLKSFEWGLRTGYYFSHPGSTASYYYLHPRAAAILASVGALSAAYAVRPSMFNR